MNTTSEPTELSMPTTDNLPSSDDPNCVIGTNGFTLKKPFPYKNAQGDIFCVVCCLQKGEMVFQPKANFKVSSGCVKMFFGQLGLS